LKSIKKIGQYNRKIDIGIGSSEGRNFAQLCYKAFGNSFGMTVVALSKIDRISKLFIEAVSKSIFTYLRNCNKKFKKEK
jgi:hypothetical protein